MVKILSHNVDIYEITTMYTSNILCFICELYLNKAGEEEVAMKHYTGYASRLKCGYETNSKYMFWEMVYNLQT